MTSRDACRLAYAAMVLALTVACTPKPEEPAAAPVADAPAIAPVDTASGPAAPNTEDTLAAAAPAPDVASPAPATPAPATSTPATPAQPAPPAAATQPDLALGLAAYTRTCVMCHGPDGKGTPIAKAIATTNVDAIRNKIVKGMIAPGDKMPPMGASLSPEELEAVTHFVASGFKAQ